MSIFKTKKFFNRRELDRQFVYFKGMADDREQYDDMFMVTKVTEEKLTLFKSGMETEVEVSNYLFDGGEDHPRDEPILRVIDRSQYS